LVSQSRQFPAQVAQTHLTPAATHQYQFDLKIHNFDSIGLEVASNVKSE